MIIGKIVIPVIKKIIIPWYLYLFLMRIEVCKFLQCHERTLCFAFDPVKIVFLSFLRLYLVHRYIYVYFT